MSEKIIFKTIAGTLIHYARPPVAPYGTRGKPKAQCGPVEPSFLAALEAWITTLGELCPWGKPDLLVTAGIVGNGHGMHGLGRAADWDSIWWPQGHLLCTSGRSFPARYYAIEATLRMHFGVVLNMDYNSAHEDHWHVDDGQPVGWMEKLSRVLFLQAALKNIWGLSVAIDGVYGKKTDSAINYVLTNLLDLPRDSLVENWIEFLTDTARKGFSQAL